MVQMTRSSPGVRRVAAILNFIASHPGESFALSEIVRALKLSRATCHALLTGLVEVGYLFRTNNKTYVLGPALAAIGRAAADNISPLQVAQPEMRQLADQFDVVCSACFLDGDTIEVRARAASASHVGYSIPVGSRPKLRTPFAAPFLTWMPEQDMEQWLATASPAPTPEQCDMLRRSMGFARRHGFVLFLTNPDAEFDLTPEEIFSREHGNFPVSPAFDLDPDGHYDANSVIAPVFDAIGKVSFVVTLMGMRGKKSGREVTEIANALIASCGRISAYLSNERTIA